MRKMDRGIPIVRLALAAAALVSMALVTGAAQSTVDTARPYAYLKTRGTYLNTSFVLLAEPAREPKEVVA